MEGAENNFWGGRSCLIKVYVIREVKKSFVKLGHKSYQTGPGLSFIYLYVCFHFLNAVSMYFSIR